jgi:putative iron-regulated protein
MTVRPAHFVPVIVAPVIAATFLAMALSPVQAAGPDKREVVAHYADLALAVYEDSLAAAKQLRRAVDGLITRPGTVSHDAARKAWLSARVPYLQTEVYRFGNPVVDEWEGKVNSWPLDEGLIDYVDVSHYGSDREDNVMFVANVIANRHLTVGGKPIDAARIDEKLIRALHEIDDVEANVATGYHAIEFLLWGQDLNGTGPGAGARPWTDFSLSACTGGNCERRQIYLSMVTDLLVADLEEAVGFWRDGGAARESLISLPADQGIAVIITGMGSLSYGELAGERMQLGLMLHDPEEEQDCFSDNTHNSHFYDALGIRNVYTGRYVRTDGRVLVGPSLSDLTRAREPQLDEQMRANLGSSLDRLGRIKQAADSGEMAYDQMLGEDNASGNAMVQDAIDALVMQTRTLERVVAALALGSIAFQGSESLDNSKAVFQ